MTRLLFSALTLTLFSGAFAQTINLDSIETVATGGRITDLAGANATASGANATEANTVWSLNRIQNELGAAGYLEYTVTYAHDDNAATWGAVTAGGPSRGDSITMSFVPQATPVTGPFYGLAMQNNTEGFGYVVSPINGSSFSFATTFGGGNIADSADRTSGVRGSSERFIARLFADGSFEGIVEHFDVNGLIVKTDTTSFTTGITDRDLLLIPRRNFRVGYDTGANTLNTPGFDPNGTWSVGVSDASLTPVPEPATMAALGLGALALLRRRRASK